MMQDIHAQRILILDFGSQYTQLIAQTSKRNWRLLRISSIRCQPPF